MIGLVFVTHGGIGAEMLNTVTSTFGPQENAQAVSVGNNDDMDQCRSAISLAMQKVNTGSGVLVMTDLQGGTPSNLAVKAMSCSDMDAVALAGVSLPTVFKVVSIRSKPEMTPTRAAQEAIGDVHTHAVLIPKTAGSTASLALMPGHPGPLHHEAEGQKCG